MRILWNIGLLIYLLVSTGVASDTSISETLTINYKDFANPWLHSNQNFFSDRYHTDRVTPLFKWVYTDQEMQPDRTELYQLQTDTLPSNMPTITRVLWGKNGLMRKLKLAPGNRHDEQVLRRNMLLWHQRLGLVTVASLLAQFTTGKLIYNNPAEYYDKYYSLHRKLGYTTYGLYLSTASLSLLAPPARKYSRGLSSIKIHRYLAVVHFSAMIIQPWLAYQAVNTPRYDYYIDLHNQVGTIATISLSLAFLSILLP